jgi:competence protein ComEA
VNNQPPEADKPQWPRVILRRTDQATSAAVAVLALVIIALWCARQAHLGGRTIDIERAEPFAIDTKIDVNRAEWPELALLPNIGEQLAKQIVADRTERGPFKDLEDLLRVKGIGPKTLETLRPFLSPLPLIQSTAENPPRPDPAKFN